MLNHSGSRILHTEHLVLRPYRPDDSAQIFRNWASDTKVADHVSWDVHSSSEMTQSLVKQWVESYASPTVYRWGIEQEGVLIGDIAVVRWQEREESCEIGYCLGSRYWNRGLMTEALKRVIDYLMDDVGFHRIMLCHDTKNPASGRVMEKCGLKKEGVFREMKKRKDGTWMDVAFYAVLSKDRK